MQHIRRVRNSLVLVIMFDYLDQISAKMVSFLLKGEIGETWQLAESACIVETFFQDSFDTQKTFLRCIIVQKEQKLYLPGLSRQNLLGRRTAQQPVGKACCTTHFREGTPNHNLMGEGGVRTILKIAFLLLPNNYTTQKRLFGLK